MNKNLPLVPPRQQKFEFAGVDLWRQLPPQNRSQCGKLVTQLIVEVIHQEQDEREDNDRQDSN